MRMNKTSFNKRALPVILKEQEGSLQWYYGSFATEKDFLGAVVMQAHGPVTLALGAHRLGINPGGQLLALSLPNEELPGKKWRNRLLSREQVQQIWLDAKPLGEFKENEER